MSKIIGILAVVAQALNFALAIFGTLRPTWAIWIAAALAGVQAFTKSIADKTPQQ